ncbi:MAG: general secretion pathway protein GspA [Gemmatales bacterium]|nr:MAG: general secretion pathway protein GspA [Gemmatales bacterium]
MFESHFGFGTRPFRPMPDTSLYYPATSHELALRRIAQALADGEGFVLLTGEPGSGKTLLCLRLLQQLGESAATVFLTNSHLRQPAELLQAILYDSNEPYRDRSEQELRLAVTDLFLSRFQSGGTTVVVIDEAQNLSQAVLEEIRLLGNLEGQRKAVQFVFAALPAMVTKLRRVELAALAQRLAVRVQLEPLSRDEAVDYLRHQVQAVGGRADRVFTGESLEILAEGTKGNPRLLNQAAALALEFACQAEAKQVDAEAAIEALAALGLNDEVDDDPPIRVTPASDAGVDPPPPSNGDARKSA